MLYIVEIREPTNCPGDYITKLLFDTKEKAEAFVGNYIKGVEEHFKEQATCEWDDQGPNWKNLKTLISEEGELVISIDEINVEKGLHQYGC